MVNGFALELFGGHVGRGAGALGEFEGVSTPGLGEIEVNEADVPVGGDEHVLGFEIEVHVTAVMDVFEGFAYVDDDVADVLAQFFGRIGDPFFEIGAFEVLHGHEGNAFDLAVFEIVDNVVVLVDVRQNFASGVEAFFGGAIASELGKEFADGDGLSFGIGRLPEIGHAAGVNEFDEVVGTKGTGFVLVRKIGFWGERI